MVQVLLRNADTLNEMLDSDAKIKTKPYESRGDRINTKINKLILIAVLIGAYLVPTIEAHGSVMSALGDAFWAFVMVALYRTVYPKDGDRPEDDEY